MIFEGNGLKLQWWSCLIGLEICCIFIYFIFNFLIASTGVTYMHILVLIINISYDPLNLLLNFVLLLLQLLYSTYYILSFLLIFFQLSLNCRYFLYLFWQRHPFLQQYYWYMFILSLCLTIIFNQCLTIDIQLLYLIL